jgi:hypothetical protein
VGQEYRSADKWLEGWQVVRVHVRQRLGAQGLTRWGSQEAGGEGAEEEEVVLQQESWCGVEAWMVLGGKGKVL